MERVLATIVDDLSRTFTIVIFKSGVTKETRNGMLVPQAAYEKRGLNFGRQAVAITMAGSDLEKYTIANQWLERFPCGIGSEVGPANYLWSVFYRQSCKVLIFMRCCAEPKTVMNLNRSQSITKTPSLLISLALFVPGNGKG